MAKNSELEQLNNKYEGVKMMCDIHQSRLGSLESEYFGYRKGITEALVSLAGKHIEFD